MKKQISDFEVTLNQRISDVYFVLHLRCCDVLPPILPGQFAEVLVPNSQSTYLRRPISIYDVDYESNTILLLIKVVGQGTKALSMVEAGKKLNLVFPLGNSFGLPSGKKALLIGGGVGIAPMLLLAKQLSQNGYEPAVLIGGRTAADIIEPDRYAPYAAVHVSTEDGSMGEKGLLTQHPVLKNQPGKYSKIYACGPDAMMKAVARIAHSQHIDCEVSLEHMMACGIGACLCCVVETTGGNRTTCVEGPVFDTRELKSW